VLTVEPQIVDSYVRGGQVGLVFRDVLNHGELSLRTSEAAACAGRQGYFWHMHELLFAQQDVVYGTGEGQLVELMTTFAVGLEGLDQAAFGACVAERQTLDALRAADAEQRGRGIVFQPVFEIGERRLAGFQSFEAMSATIEEALAASSP
jgi:protein-disulfide isomerase